ncbi:MAG: AbrB/MazE/SpoVT family DNA-binding domain-containing protein [Phycisphaerales bacterium]|nr:AbrB/MazE/SpoVT family DNA-binding domain-containing protein [Phycisphaerales bacterium]
MQTARLFTNGNSQAVRLPKEFRFEGDEIIIKKVGNAVILLPKTYDYHDLKALLGEIGPLDLERQQPETDQPRDFR